MQKDTINITKRKLHTRKVKDLIFYITVLAFPVIQFCIFYICVNFNSIFLAFKQYDFEMGNYVWIGFDNFSKFLTDLTVGSLLKTAISNSLKLFVFNFIFGTTLSLVFSYYIFKKYFLSGMFRVILFLPSIVSAIVMVIIFKFTIDEAVPGILKSVFKISMESPMSSASTRFAMIIFYNIWISFGTGVILYSGSMSQIDISVIEYGKIDGVTPFKEFRHIILPLIYPIFTTFFIISIAGIFINQANLYSFYQDLAINEVYTLGYFLFQRVIGRSATLSAYPYASAAGLVFTIIAVPLTLGIKALLEKFGPSIEQKTVKHKRGEK